MLETTTAVEHLQAVGFSEYEARAYVALLQRGQLTGYEVAKVSGIPRPNVYPVIDRLERRGAVTRVKTARGLKYAALPAADVLARVSRSVESHLAGAGEALESLTADAAESAYVWNIDGYADMIAAAEDLIDGARDRIAIGVWSNESASLAPTLARAEARGVEVVILCIQGCPHECGNCRGSIFRYAVAGAATTRWFMLVADEQEAIVGRVASTGDAKAARTALDVVVSMTAQYLQNAIATAEIVRSLGDELPAALDPEAAQLVQGETLALGGLSWLNRITSVVRRARG